MKWWNEWMNDEILKYPWIMSSNKVFWNEVQKLSFSTCIDLNQRKFLGWKLNYVDTHSKTEDRVMATLSWQSIKLRGAVTKLWLFNFVFEKLLIKTQTFRLQRSLGFLLLMSSLLEAVKTEGKICVSSLKQSHVQIKSIGVCLCCYIKNSRNQFRHKNSDPLSCWFSHYSLFSDIFSVDFVPSDSAIMPNSMACHMCGHFHRITATSLVGSSTTLSNVRLFELK